MMISAKQKRTIYILWLLVVPLLFYIALNYFPARSYDYANMAIYLAILIVTLKISITLDKVSITLERWIVFSVFFQYGIVAEMFFMQIAMFVSLFMAKSSTPKGFRFASNSINYAVVSIISGAIFYAFGGSIQEISLGAFLFAGFLYASTYSLVNSGIIYLLFKWLKSDTSKMRKAVWWDYIATLLLLPFAITFCLLMQQFESKAFLLIGVPFLIVLLVASNYMKSNKLNEVLSSSTVISHQLADSLRVEDVLLTFIDKIKGVIPYDSAYIIDLRVGENLVMLAFKEGEFRSNTPNRFSFPSKKPEGDGLELQGTKLFLT